MATIADPPKPPPSRSALAANPGHEIKIEAGAGRLRVVCNGETIADSTQTLVLHETGIPPRHYFPRADVGMDFLRRTDHHTTCPFKGNAAYWSIEAGGETVVNAAWSYEQPYEEVSEIKGCISFYPDRVNILAADP